MTLDVDFRLRRSGGFDLDVQFQVPTQGVTALFGRSGCGKTTLLRCIAGLERAAGHCLVDGEVWQQGRTWRPPYRRPIGYVFQEASLFPHLSVEGNLNYARRRSDPSDHPLRSSDIIELLAIGPLLKRRPERLSGGERQRVAIARALLSNPRLLLMDEPLAALDQMAKATILPYLERLHQTLQLPLLYVSHDLREVTRLADRMLLLEGGRVRAQGAIGRLITALDLPLVEADDAASILEGVVSGHDETYHLTHINCGGNRVLVPREEMAIGSHARIQIYARDVSLALRSHHDTTILNLFPAQIVDTRDLDQRQLLVQLRLHDDQRLLARITRRSGVALGLHEGMWLYAQVKSVALLG